MTHYLTWQGVEDDTLEHCEIQQYADGFRVQSEITGIMNGKPIKLYYNILLDHSWHVVEFTAKNKSEKNLFELYAFQKLPAHWFDKNDIPIYTFDGCIDIDIFPTPFTNSLPLKRDPLKIGDQKEFNMLWVDLLAGVARKDRQQYLRVGEHIYQFNSLDTGFTEVIEFNNDMFVAFYPRLFRLIS